MGVVGGAWGFGKNWNALASCRGQGKLVAVDVWGLGRRGAFCAALSSCPSDLTS